ncbi:MAG: hypothetical protein K8S94_13040 [Planctomycetia bacterium]|nr:hypothetical protein [Planctomycetia bacterium]
MATAERTYLVPCACSARVAVTAGQAGGRVACPACGGSIDVPRLRDLEQYEVTAVTSGEPLVGWDASRGLLFAGVAIALVATVAAANVARIGGGMFPQPPADNTIRAAVRAAPIVDVHAAWQAIAVSGVQRPPTEEEIRIGQFSRTAGGISMVLWGVAGLGAALAAAGGAMLASRGRPAGGRS